MKIIPQFYELKLIVYTACTTLIFVIIFANDWFYSLDTWIKLYLKHVIIGKIKMTANQRFVKIIGDKHAVLRNSPRLSELCRGVC